MLYQLSTIELPLFQSSYGALNCRRGAPASECSLLERSLSTAMAVSNGCARNIENRSNDWLEGLSINSGGGLN